VARRSILDILINTTATIREPRITVTAPTMATVRITVITGIIEFMATTVTIIGIITTGEISRRRDPRDARKVAGSFAQCDVAHLNDAEPRSGRAHGGEEVGDLAVEPFTVRGQ
jgi:hypothetical protein